MSYFTVGGDLIGLAPNPTLSQIQGIPVSAIAPTTNQALVYNGSQWLPTVPTIPIVFDSAATPTNPTSLTNGIWYGLNTKANSFDSTCITLGQNAKTSFTESIALGVNALSVIFGPSAIAIGTNAGASGGYGGFLAIGPNTQSWGNGNEIAIGNAAGAIIASNIIAIGASSAAEGEGGVSIGASSQAAGSSTKGDVVIGTSANNVNFNGVAIGTGATPLSAASTFALVLNSASVIPGSLGVTVNGAAYKIQMLSSLFATTAGSGPTTLTATSGQFQVFTTAQTVVLPVVSTLQLGFYFVIINESAGNVVVESSGANVLATLAPSTWAFAVCQLSGGTTATSWALLEGGSAVPGTVTQLTSNTTGVTVNASQGLVTMFGTLAAGSVARFTVTNSRVQATSVIEATAQAVSSTGGFPTVVGIMAVGTGTFDVIAYNTDPSNATTAAPIIHFNVLFPVL